MTERTCKEEGCERPHKAYGWCKLHYRRWKEHGDPQWVRDRRCSEDGCDEPHEARGLCNKHYLRLRIHGSTADPSPDRLTLFRAKVVTGEGGCWLWTGATNRHGYGQFWMGERLMLAHRWAYEHYLGPIPDGLELDHLCRVRRCANPLHLEPVTASENRRRGLNGVLRVLKTHCPQGHPYAGDNLYVNPNTGHRLCRTCRDAHVAAFKARRRAERR